MHQASTILQADPTLAPLPGRRRWQAAACRDASVAQQRADCSTRFSGACRSALPRHCVIWRWRAQILRPAQWENMEIQPSRKGVGWGLGKAQGTVTTGTAWLGLGLTSTGQQGAKRQEHRGTDLQSHPQMLKEKTWLCRGCEKTHCLCPKFCSHINFWSNACN